MLTFYARTECATIWVFTVKWPDAKCKANTVPPAAIPAPPSQSICAFPGKQHHCWKQTPSGSRFPVNCSILPRLSFGCLKVTLKSYTQTNMTAGIWFLYVFSERDEIAQLPVSSAPAALWTATSGWIKSITAAEQSDSEVYLFDMNCASHVKVNGLFTSFPYIVHGQLLQAGVR